MKVLTREERQELLKSAGITINFPPEQGLAMKADFAIPWNKLRIIWRYIYTVKYMYMYTQLVSCLYIYITQSRWLTEWNVRVVSEPKLRKRSKEIITTNLLADAVPFTFSLKSGGEEIEAAPLVYVPDLKKIF